MLTAIIIITSITQILVSSFVFLRGRKNLSYFLFFLIGITTLGWALLNYLAIVYLKSPHIIYFVRVILLFVVLQNAFFYLFARTFPETNWKHSKKWLSLYGLFTLSTAALTLSPLVFTAVDTKDGLPVTQAAPAILVFIAHASISIGLAFKALIKKVRKATGVQRNQLQILLIASILTWVIVPITNFAITPLLKTTIFIVVSPLYTLAFASLIAYAIAAQKLFDIRTAVARSVAYLSSLGFIGLIYGLFIFGLSSIVTFNDLNDYIQRGVYIGFALLTAILFQPVREYFARVTNKIFYQDAYDTQAFLNELNGVFVSTIELKVLLKQSLAIIEKNIKPEFCSFAINKTSSTDASFVGTNWVIREQEVENIQKVLKGLRQKIIIADDLTSEQDQLKVMLSYNNIAALIRLAPSVGGAQEVGYLFLGYKKSGNSYNRQDIQNLEIIAKELVVAIQNALRFEEIENFNITLQQKVNEATKELRRSNEKLRILDQTKDEFISMASHQLRTPLTSVKGYVSMVLEGDAGKLSPMQRKLLDQAFLSSQRMVYLIADLLNVSRLRTGKFLIEPKPTNLADIVQGEISQLLETAKARNIELTYEQSENIPLLMLDETKMRQVVMNFVDNAIYYTPAGGHITVKVVDKPESIEFTVKDDGIGVPKSEQHHLFDKFYRANNARKARPDGTGLGLFMAKKVIVAQGGAIIFKSQEGKGSTFGFTLAKAALQVKTHPSQ